MATTGVWLALVRIMSSSSSPSMDVVVAAVAMTTSEGQQKEHKDRIGIMGTDNRLSVVRCRAGQVQKQRFGHDDALCVEFQIFKKVNKAKPGHTLAACSVVSYDVATALRLHSK